MPRIDKNVVDGDGNKFKVRRVNPDGSVVVSPRGATKTIPAAEFKKTFAPDKGTSKLVEAKAAKTVPAVKAKP